MPQPNPAVFKAAVASVGRARRDIFGRIKGHRPPDYIVEVLQPFKRFQRSKFDPDEFTLSKVLSISANFNALDQGKQIHAFIIKKNLQMDVAANNALINLYFKCESVGDAEKVFNGIPERDLYTWTVMVSGYGLNGCLEKAMNLFNKMPCRNTVTWNTLINAFQKEGFEETALELFSKMRLQGEPPNSLTFIAILKAYSSLQIREAGEAIHSYLVKSAWIKNTVVGCTLMDMYVKCGDLLCIQRAFDEISEHNVVSWSILLSGYALNGKIERAKEIFDGLEERNVISWNVMTAGYVKSGMQIKAFSLLVDMMKNGTRPNCFTLTSVISGCSDPQYTRSGKRYHALAIKEGLYSNTEIGNSLITMYGKQENVADARLVFDMMSWCDVVSWTAMVSAYISMGDIDEARQIFNMMPTKNLISWNTMLFGYLQDGKNAEPNSIDGVRNLSALTFYFNMEHSDVKPDHFSYNCVLSACAGIGALEQTRRIHGRTVKNGFEGELGVGNALITAYGKCGALREAEIAFNNMQNPDMVSWNALLTAYSQNGKGNEVLSFYEKMQTAGVKPNCITFISLLSACSYLGEVSKGQEYFDGMENGHGINPTKEHYACMVDLFGRAGHLNEAESIVQKMPIEPDVVVWAALLGACKIHGNPDIGRRAADRLFDLEPDNSSAYVALAEIFAAARMWEDVAKLRVLMNGNKLLKEPGYSTIEIRNQTYTFLSGNSYSQHTECAQEILHNVYGNMTDDGGSCDSVVLAFGIV